MRRPAALLALLASFAAAAAPALELVPARVKPGDPVLVVVRGVEGLPEGTVGSLPATFYRHGEQAEALVGIPVEEEPGLVQARVTAGALKLDAPLEIVRRSSRSGSSPWQASS